MLKKNALRRIMVSSIALFIVGILYFFPDNKTEESITPNVSYIEVNKTPIYLINKDNYVVRTNIATTNKDPLNKAKELLNALTIDGDKTEYILKNFKPIIPKNTKVLDISLKDGLLKINFSKAIIYTLTEIKDIKEIMIFIEETKLDILPQNKIILPNTLTRDFGINKVYDLTNLKNTTKTTIYYVGKENDLTYYIPITKIDNKTNNKVEIIINELKSSPIYETNLISYLASSVKLLNYEALENQIELSFNNEIFSDFKEENIQEEVKYSISLSLKDSLKVENVIFKVNDKIITTFKENN